MPIDNQLTDYVSEENKITQDVIDNLKEPRFVTLHDLTVVKHIHTTGKCLLQFSKDKHNSMEISYTISLSTLELCRVEFGNSHTVSLESQIKLLSSSNDSYLVIHNHPSNSPFSPRDIKTFIIVRSITILMVIGNKGAIYIIEKTRQIYNNELVELRRISFDYINNKIILMKVVEMLYKHDIIITHIQ